MEGCFIEERNLEGLKRYVLQTPNFNNTFNYYPGRTLLHAMVNANWFEGVCYLCKIPGVNVNVKSQLAKWPPIAYAINHNARDSYKMVIRLLECGAHLEEFVTNSIDYKRACRDWINAHQKAVATCRRTCYYVLWAKKHMHSALKEPMHIIAKMIWKTQRKHYWLQRKGSL